MEALALQKRLLVALLAMLVVACVTQVNDIWRGETSQRWLTASSEREWGACNNEGLASVPCLNEGAPPPAPDKSVISLQ